MPASPGVLSAQASTAGTRDEAVTGVVPDCPCSASDCWIRPQSSAPLLQRSGSWGFSGVGPMARKPGGGSCRPQSRKCTLPCFKLAFQTSAASPSASQARFRPHDDRFETNLAALQGRRIRAGRLGGVLGSPGHAAREREAATTRWSVPAVSLDAFSLLRSLSLR
jgi:hypothetical protein